MVLTCFDWKGRGNTQVCDLQGLQVDFNVFLGGEEAD